ncbi:MAG: STAS domain-containing protein [Planctomycetia bacterium]
MPGLVITTRREGPTGRVGVVQVVGELTLEHLPRLLAEVEALVGAGAAHLAFDLAALAFVDSRSLGALLLLEQRRRAAGGKVVLSGLRPALVRSLHAAGLGALLPVVPDLPTALARLH